MNCVTNKVDVLSDLVCSQKIDILAVSETWLRPSVSSSFISLLNYSAVRGDSDGGTDKHGVLLYINKLLKYEVITVNLPNVAAVHLIDLDVWVVAVYRPPRYSDFENTQLLNFISDFGFSKELILLGDFNLHTYFKVVY